jgi:hypothetical protein
MRLSGTEDRLQTPHRHGLLIGALFALGTIVGVVAVLAVTELMRIINGGGDLASTEQEGST